MRSPNGQAACSCQGMASHGSGAMAAATLRQQVLAFRMTELHQVAERLGLKKTGEGRTGDGGWRCIDDALRAAWQVHPGHPGRVATS